MNEPLTLGLAAVAGSALGTIFFGGLLWTVRKGVTADQPALWFLGSLLLRMGIAFRGHLGRLLACIAGFALARLVVTCLTRPIEDVPPSSREVGHAP